MTPNFLGIGTQRAATTWLHNCLAAHPDIYVPNEKELNFFNRNYAEGLMYYERYFDQAVGASAIGEITPMYLYCKPCPSRIHECLGALKMIVILRNPIDRAFSAYERFVKAESGLTFEKAIKDKPGLLRMGLYDIYLRRYFSIFDSKDFLVLLYDDIVRDGMQVMKQVYGFLGVGCEFSRSHPVNTPVNSALAASYSRYLEKFGLHRIVPYIKGTPLDRVLRRLMVSKGKALKVREIDPELKVYLNAYFRGSVAVLQELIDRDLSCWGIL